MKSVVSTEALLRLAVGTNGPCGSQSCSVSQRTDYCIRAAG